MDRIFQNIRADFLEVLVEILKFWKFPHFRISEISKMARPSGQDFPKHKGRLCGNFGKFGNFGYWISGKLGARILEILELSLAGLVTHPMTDHALRLSWRACSVNGVATIYIYIYICLFMDTHIVRYSYTHIMYVYMYAYMHVCT